MAIDRCILIDWGTTNLRAFRLDGDGGVAERRESRQGIMNVPDGAFRQVFESLVGDWRRTAPDAPVLMSGMIGSRQGWIETPYAACPVDVQGLARELTPVPGLPAAWIVPGVVCRGGRHDVMRGEEVQILGALPDRPRGRRVLCLPGTHSKWAVVEDGTLVRFHTAMTGEVYQVLSEHSILRKLMSDGEDQTVDPDAFRLGLDRARDSGGLLNHLFAVRAEGLFGTIPATGLRSYLSGILIGHEIAGLCTNVEGDTPVLLLGAPALSRLYATGLTRFGMPTDIIDGDSSTVAGLARVAAAAGI